MLSGQGEQVRCAVLESTNFSPIPHVGCVFGHVVVRWEGEVWNVFAEQLEQVRCAVLVSALIFSPLPHVDCVRQVADLCELVDWYVFAGQAWQFAELSMYWPFEQGEAARYAFNFPAAVLHADAPAGTYSCTWCTVNPLGRCSTNKKKRATQQTAGQYTCASHCGLALPLPTHSPLLYTTTARCTARPTEHGTYPPLRGR